jgi:Rieske Fe-S protein
MNRYQFLKDMGFRGAALMAVMTSCVAPEDTFIAVEPVSTTGGTTTTNPGTTTTGSKAVITNGNNPSSIKTPLVTLDLAASTNSALAKVGGYVIKSNIVIAQISAGLYAAVTVTCTHEPKNRVIYSQGEFYCTDHGARFDYDGKALNNIAPKGIKAYSIAQDGKTLVVY